MRRHNLSQFFGFVSGKIESFHVLYEVVVESLLVYCCLQKPFFLPVHSPTVFDVFAVVVNTTSRWRSR